MLLCRGPGKLSDSARAAGVDVVYLPHWVSGHASPPRADLWHAHDGKGVYWAALEGRCRGTPYVITRRVDNPLSSNRFTRASYRGAASVACLSRAISAQVEKLDPQITRTVIPSTFSSFATEPDAVSAIKHAYPGKFLVGQVGRLVPHKGYTSTIAAAQILAERIPEIHFLLLGDGPQRAELEAASAHLPNVSLLGHVDKVGPYFAAFDLFLFPSLSEGLGSSILEAMQAQTPVLAARAGGIPDIVIHAETGWLVEPGDAEGLAEALEYLYRHPDVRDRLQEGATERLSMFSPAAVAERYYDLYASILARPK